MLQKIDKMVDIPLLKKINTPKIKPLIYIIVAFILSRFLYTCLGICFDVSSMGWQWQFIDPELLRNNLFQSVYYLHSQPPLFNLFLGLILKLFPGNAVLVFKLVYLVLGLVLAISIFLIMTRLGVSDRLSVILTILFIVSPACILYENWLFYTYPVTSFLCLAALFLHKFLSSKKLRDGMLFFTLLSFVVLTRSLFHLLWFVLSALILVFYQRQDWKKIVVAFCLPFLLLISLYVKNLYVFGSFSSSTWMGMSLAKLTTLGLPVEERNELVKQGKLSSLALVNKPFRNLDTYQAYLVNVPEKTGIPVLDQKVKSGGSNNYNNIAYIDISKQYLKDALFVLRSNPKVYLSSLVRSYAYYFRPTNEYWFLEYNSGYIKPLVKFYNAVFYGKFLTYGRSELEEMREGNKVTGYIQGVLSIGIFLVLGLPFLAGYGVWTAWNSLSSKIIDLPFALTILFVCLNVLYVTIIGNAFEIMENNRFRFMIDPFFLMLLGLFITNRFRKPKRNAL